MKNGIFTEHNVAKGALKVIYCTLMSCHGVMVNGKSSPEPQPPHTYFYLIDNNKKWFCIAISSQKSIIGQVNNLRVSYSLKVTCKCFYNNLFLVVTSCFRKGKQGFHRCAVLRLRFKFIKLLFFNL